MSSSTPYHKNFPRKDVFQKVEVEFLPPLNSKPTSTHFVKVILCKKCKVDKTEILSYKKYTLVEKLFSILYSGMACNWHDYDERPQFCSLQKIKSWAYVISNHCCEEFNIELISQRHKPIDTMEEKAVIQ